MVNLSTKKYYKLVWITILSLIVFFALMDLQGLQMVKDIGGYGSDTYTKMHDNYMKLFWTFAYGMIVAVALMFWFFRRDISESIAIFIGSILVLWGGLEDIIYYWLIGKPGLDASMPWLFEAPMGLVSMIMGESTVTPIGLYLNVALFIIMAIVVVRYLKKKI